MITWQVALGIGAIALLLFLWSAQHSRHAFDLRDVLIDQASGKASLNAVILLVMALLSCWVIVDREMKGKDDLDTILLGVLGVFVTGRAVAQGINAFKPQPDAGSSTVKETVRETTTVAAGPQLDEPLPVAVTNFPKDGGNR